MRKFVKNAKGARAKGKDIYSINIGQPDIETPKEFLEAIKKFDKKVIEYADSTGIPELKAEIAKYYKRLGCDFTEDEIIVSTGGSEALYFVMTTILNSGDNIIMGEPYYAPYDNYTAMAGGYVKAIPATAEEGYRYATREKILKAIDDKTRAIAVVNPANPSGLLLTQEEMDTIVEIVKEKELFLVVDEVYREFVYDGKKMNTFAKYKGIEKNLIVCDSISKRFSGCGARIGCVISHNQEIIEAITKLAQMRLCSPELEQIGATALYKLNPNYFDKVREEYQHRRDVTYAALQRIPGILCGKPEGAFYITCKLPVDDAEKFLVFMLDEFDIDGKTVMFAPAQSFFGTPGMGKSDIRIAYVLNADDMEKAIYILGEGIKAYNSRQKGKQK
ncbi:MAG: pyridoxal phosphate-dependent aminotransferase [Clostridium sp.]|uniref:pyridoxal phosphate-dependent aminotransferase n=1 Tax=Clostridium sp. TaxID=1506 RepID=UPI0025BF3D9A|nr:pyridoxal phosphate-dependent aminotransferase [Clostridium sp.]MCF0148321.1 pyridoxal phosphate-dependent aminotransferase [Clostridium sp.]